MINPELIMKLTLQRIQDNGTSTLGIMYLDGEFLCYTLEDTFRAEKVDGKTRVPAGEYVIATREVMSPLTEKYREQYDYFSYHLELQEVPNFQYVYITSVIGLPTPRVAYWLVLVSSFSRSA